MARKRLDPNVVAEWVGIADAAERAIQSGSGSDRASALWRVAEERGTTEQHVRRLIHGWRFIQSVRAQDPELAKSLERSSYNVTDVISRWHPRAPSDASQAAKQYHAGALTLAQLRNNYEALRTQEAPKPPAPPASDYLEAVRLKVETISPWIRNLESTPHPLIPFGSYNLHFRGNDGRELGVIAIAPDDADEQSQFITGAGLILLGEKRGIASIIAGPKGGLLDRYANWIREIGLDDCRVIQMERVVREVWA